MGKYTIADPSGFKQKLRVMQKTERAKKVLGRQDSKRSGITEMTGTTHDKVSNSNKSGTGTSDGASSGRLSNNDSEKEAAEKNEDEEQQHEDDTNNGL